MFACSRWLEKVFDHLIAMKKEARHLVSYSISLTVVQQVATPFSHEEFFAY